MSLRTQVALLGALNVLGACAATPPPVAVDTPFGRVCAESSSKADEVAELLSDLSPGVQELLPGTKDREVDVWVQSVLRDSRGGERAEAVKGYTLLIGDFQAKRIHLLQDGELAWYLSHELVHALMDESWSTLPGILEEGLADVVAEMLNEEHAARIRAHRLFNSSYFFGGLVFPLAYQEPENDGEWTEGAVFVQPWEDMQPPDIEGLLACSRQDLRREYPELPEPFYGLAYLVVARIVERGGLDALHSLCIEAEAAGQEVIPSTRLLEAAALDLERFGPELLAVEFGREEARQILLMQAETVSRSVVAFFQARLGDISTRTLLYRVNPCLRSSDGSLLRLRSLWPLRRKLVEQWRSRPRTTQESARGPR